ncbi:MAG: type I-U CRISPR-associated protein Cas8c [Myxococcota bacterium]|nr:type I-U CRISPR-associated protein Cas8c [Myxococcota bacterium]
MGESSIPLNLLNPGQVFACIGFTEAAQHLIGRAEAAFDWSDEAQCRFALRASGAADPFEEVLRFLATAEVVGQAPPGSGLTALWISGWGKVESLPLGSPYPYPEPSSPATLRAVLRAGGRELAVEHWGDGTRRDATKFWAGARGYPGAALARDALALVRDRCVGAARDPFALAAPQSSSFRLDWRRDYIPIDTGFSLNKHGSRIQTVGFPLVELLGAVGLGHARPQRPDPRNKLEYRYGVVGRGNGVEWYPPAILRAALGCSSLAFPSRRFRMILGWPGKEGQARSITTVTEETTE